jgi:hypothetical protein
MRINNDMQRLIAAIPEGAENIIVIFRQRQVADFDCSASWQFRKENSQSMHDFFAYINRQGVGDLQELVYDLNGKTHEVCMNERIIEYWKTFGEAVILARNLES